MTSERIAELRKEREKEHVKEQETIDQLLLEANIYPDEQEEKHRGIVIRALDEIIKNWIESVAQKLDRNTRAYASSPSQYDDDDSEEEEPEFVPRKTCYKLVSFGSYQLGVHTSGSDIDILVIAPDYVQRMHFFKELLDILEFDENVSNVNPIPLAYVPIMKFVLHDIHIDLLFARLTTEAIQSPTFNILDDKNMTGVDEETQRSLNGPRVAALTLLLVPDKEKFKRTLRSIKFWAQRRGIYSNIFGYLGGIAWAILVAKICIMYPDAKEPQLIEHFFKTYRHWRWPTPVMLRDVGTRHYQRYMRVWDPRKNTADQFHLMPIITPAYPNMNSSYNICLSTLHVIMEEFVRGHALCQYYKLRDHNRIEKWNTIFQPSDFFVRYANYLQIEVTADTEAEHMLYTCYIESKFRILYYKLETFDGLTIHPFPTGVQMPKKTKGDITTSLYYIGLSYSRQDSPLDIQVAIQQFLPMTERWEKRTAGMRPLQISIVKRSNIPSFVATREEKLTSIKQRQFTSKILEAYHAHTKIAKPKKHIHKYKNGNASPMPSKHHPFHDASSKFTHHKYHKNNNGSSKYYGNKSSSSSHHYKHKHKSNNTMDSVPSSK